jgi:hypothetical protein
VSFGENVVVWIANIYFFLNKIKEKEKGGSESEPAHMSFRVQNLRPSLFTRACGDLFK